MGKPVDHLSVAARTAFLRALKKASAGNVLTERAEVERYASDALTQFRRSPLAVVLPANEPEVCAITRICSEFGVPIVARGAGTGLSGGATPHWEGIVLSIARLNKIVRIEPEACTATVQAGVRNAAVSDAAGRFGLFYSPDPSSQLACTIGGNVAENSGGVHCLKYGLTLHNVQRVRAVLADGTVAEFGSETSWDVPGLDLLSVLVGSEGMFAIATEVTVKLRPRPVCARMIVASFWNVGSASNAVADLIASGITPSALEMMDAGAIRAAEAFSKAGYDCEAAAILLCECDGSASDVDEEIDRVTAVFQRHGCTKLRFSTDDHDRARLWSGRKSAFPAAGRISPDYYCVDGTVPRRKVAAVLDRISKLSVRYGLRCFNVFHAGDGNLHPLVLFDAARVGEWERAEAFGAAILEECINVGGTVTGEHGVGLEKLDSMCHQFASDELECFAGVRSAFDHLGLFNPGKAIPTLSRCAEQGRMRVSRGKLPFPDLPRF